MISVDLRCFRICRPSSSRDLLGDAAEEVLAVGVNSGFLVGREDSPFLSSIHFLEAFYARSSLSMTTSVRDAAISDALRVLLEASRWEDAFDLALRCDRLERRLSRRAARPLSK